MRHGFVKIACGTPSIRVADPLHNKEKILSLIKEAHKAGIHLLALPELTLTGSTCGDLFFQSTLSDVVNECVLDICKAVPKNIVVVFGAPVSVCGKLFNAAVVASGGNVLGIVVKNQPDSRYFATLDGEAEFDFYGLRVKFSSSFLFKCNTMADFVFAVELGDDLFSLNSNAVRLAYSGANLIVNIASFEAYSGRWLGICDAAVSKSSFLKCAYLLASSGDGESTTDYVYTAQNLIVEEGLVLSSHSMKEDSVLSSEIDTQTLCFHRRKDSEFRRSGAFSGAFNGAYCGAFSSAFNGKPAPSIGFDLEIGETTLTRNVLRDPFLPEDTKKKNAECEKILTLQALGLKKRIVHTNSKKVFIGISGGLDSTLALLVAVRAFDMLSMDRRGIICVTMPCFGTSDNTKNNAIKLTNSLGCTLKEINISDAVTQHFDDIGQDRNLYNTAFENAQARERTQVLMDLSNKEGGFVVGTGDLSELALGWATYNGDHMSMYSVNGSVPKTVIREIVRFRASQTENVLLKDTLNAILDTPVSPELLPGSQNTEEILGSYELHDFFVYNILCNGYSPSKTFRLAKYAFSGYFSDMEIQNALKVFYKRFFSQQFKRSCMPDGPAVTAVTLSPRGGFVMPSDANSAEFLKELEESFI